MLQSLRPSYSFGGGPGFNPYEGALDNELLDEAALLGQPSERDTLSDGSGGPRLRGLVGVPPPPLSPLGSHMGMRMHMGVGAGVGNAPPRPVRLVPKSHQSEVASQQLGRKQVWMSKALATMILLLSDVSRVSASGDRNTRH